MNTFECEFEKSQYTCCVNEELGGIEILSGKNMGARPRLPEILKHNGQIWEVRGIGKKAFFGCQELRSVTVPGTVKRIDAWAFSQCRQLEGICIPAVCEEKYDKGLERDFTGNYTEFGTGVFTDCPNLSYIGIGVSETDDMAVLLAAAIHQMPSEDLLNDPEPGGEHWYRKWDLRLQSFMNEDDEEGYTSIVLCGEEDIIKSVPEYKAAKRRRKAALCMLRLMHDRLLLPENRKVYTDYLLNHTKGCDTEDAWEEIVLEYGENMEYYQLMADIGGIHADNVDAMIQDLDALHAEAKAFLIRYKQEHFATGDVFDMFTL